MTKGQNQPEADFLDAPTDWAAGIYLATSLV
jgi:hypothetical protein